jgi:predicted alpha/beta-hydrolase family hydrolase
MTTGLRIHRILIKGASKLDLDNTFFRAEGTSRKAALVLPGLGYTCQGPLLYYMTRMMVERGYDVLNVHYNYSEVKETDFEHIGLADGMAALEALKEQGEYEEVVIVGKSLGTMVMSLLLRHGKWPMIENTKKLIWLTPGWSEERFISEMVSCTIPSLQIIGTFDRHFSPEWKNRVVANKNMKVSTIEGADHSLETGKYETNIALLSKVMTQVSSFL